MITKIKCAGLLASLFLIAGCGTGKDSKDPATFFTSGNREADQRAEQRMAKSEQLKGKGQDGGGGGSAASRPPTPLTLYERLGGEQGIQAIMDDFVPRALADPRVNWVRKGVTHGVFRSQSAEWEATGANVERLKVHLRQFISVATGGPSEYQGRGMKEAHHGMKITNVEFDATVGDLKASLDKLGIATAEQKEILAIVESTRAQVVEVR